MDDFFFCSGSTVPNQPAGAFWAVVSSLLVIFQTIVLLREFAFCAGGVINAESVQSLKSAGPSPSSIASSPFLEVTLVWVPLASSNACGSLSPHLAHL